MKVWRLRWRFLAWIAAMLVMSLAGCSRQGAAPPTVMPAVGDATAGRALFRGGVKPACASCHTIEGLAGGQTGPELTHIGTIAAQRVNDANVGSAATDAASYLREAIVTPNAAIAPQCPTGECFKDIMPQTYGETLSEQELSDLVAFLLSQR